MSQALNSVAVEQFDTEVKHAYQGMKTLRDCVKVRNNVTGDKYDFRIMGKGAATARTGSSADVVPMDVGHTIAQAVLTDYEAPEYTDIYDAATVNFDEVVELATTIAGAMGRRDDQSILDAMSAGGTSVDKSTALLTTPLLILTDAAERLNKVEAPLEDRYFICDETFIDSMLNNTTITSADYNSVRLLMTGEVDTFMGFKFKIIGSARAEGGLGSDIQYAYHKASVGHAVGIDMKTRVDWVPHKASWLSLGMWKAGSKVIDAEGVIKYVP